MKIVHWLVGSRLWVALGAAAWTAESFVRSGEWVRWTLVLHVFFLTWSAYLFLSDDATRKHRASVLASLTGVCITFQGFESILFPMVCAALVLLYRTHWMPSVWWLARFEMRNIPMLNNLAIASCWVLLCMMWPLKQVGASFSAELPSMLAAFLWLTALSMSEDLFIEEKPDATLRLLGQRGLRIIAGSFVLLAIALSYIFHERQLSVWLSLSASLLLVLFIPGGKRTAIKSWLIDAMIVLRFPF
jgi:hypothetical protein